METRILLGEYTTQIRERHLDTFGHVNNAQYLVLCEEARWEMITSRGYGLQRVHETQVGTVVLECSVRFSRELKLREKITIQTFSLGDPHRKVQTLQHLFLKANGEVAATADFKIACFDLKNRKIIPPSSEWLNAIFGNL